MKVSLTATVVATLLACVNAKWGDSLKYMSPGAQARTKEMVCPFLAAQYASRIPLCSLQEWTEACFECTPPTDQEDVDCYIEQGCMPAGASVTAPRLRRLGSRSFQGLGDGYGKDSFDVYYYGNEVDDAKPSSFQVLGDGYGKDSFRVFYNGNEVDDAKPSSFQVLGDGYGKDSFRVFYNGNEVDDASPSSFQVHGNGYGKDSFRVFYRGQRMSGRRLRHLSGFRPPKRNY